MADLHAWVSDINPDIVGVTETWADKDMLDKEFTIPGFDLFHCDRPVARHGGGVMLFAKSTLQAVEYFPKTQFPEQVWCIFNSTRSNRLVVGVCYRTPSLDIYGTGNHVLLTTLLNELSTSHKQFLLMGDFNYGVKSWPVLHYDSQITDDTKCFIDAIDDNFLTQHAHTPTS